MASNVSNNPSSSNQAPQFGTLLFADDFDALSLSSEWKTIEPVQWLANGWLHTKDNNGWPRDSLAVVHDGDKTWGDYVVSVTAGFTPGTPWEYINIPLRVNGFRRSSSSRSGNAYELELVGKKGWGSADWDTIRLSRTSGSAGSSIPLFQGKWNSALSPAHIQASLSGGHIEISINGERLIDLVDPTPLMYGGVGVHAIWESEAQFDNLTVINTAFNPQFQLQENTAKGMEVGSITALDFDAGDTLTYAITAGNSDPDADSQPAFAINPTTGVISVNDSGDLDYESTARFHLQVTATDAGGLSDTAPISINLTNQAEAGNDRPEAEDASFSVLENSAEGTAVGIVTATDVDANDGLVYGITGGNSDPDADGTPAFAIDATSGDLTINDRGDINFKTSSPFRLQVTATDRGGLSDTATISVNLITINDAPFAADKTVRVAKNSSYTFKADDFGFNDVNDSLLCPNRGP
jgi:hypothetical protein